MGEATSVLGSNASNFAPAAAASSSCFTVALSMPPVVGSRMSGNVIGCWSSTLTALAGDTARLLLSLFPHVPKPLLFLNLFTLSLYCLQGMSSSGEFPVVPQPGHLFSSDSMSALRAHSSHTAHAHCGIMMQSRRRSWQTGHFRSSGISTLGARTLARAFSALASSSSQTGLSIL